MNPNDNRYRLFGERLTLAMLKRNISNIELADEMYVSPSTISGYRTGRRSPTVADLASLASLLNVSADYLIGTIDTDTGSGRKRRTNANRTKNPPDRDLHD